MTLLELRNAVRKRLGETTAAFWTDAEINAYVNQGAKDLSWRTKCLRTTGYISSISCTANTVSACSNEYTISTALSTACYAITEVYFKEDGTDFVRLNPTTREELDVQNPAWQSLIGYTYSTTASTVTTYNYTSNTSTPTDYYWSREEDVFGLYPPPDADNSGTNYIKVYYAYTHTDVSTDSASPTIPSGLHPAIIDFATATGLEDRGWGDRANDFWSKYFKKISDYVTERKNEREDDELIMKSYRNV